MHALLATRHSARVTVVDINERALAFTRVNAQLNGAPDVECRQESWFDPVSDQAFDMVVSNPPFVVSPESEFLFRDCPLPADELLRMLVIEAADHLVDGGFAHILCNWALTEGRTGPTHSGGGSPRRGATRSSCTSAPGADGVRGDVERTVEGARPVGVRVRRRPVARLLTEATHPRPLFGRRHPVPAAGG